MHKLCINSDLILVPNHCWYRGHQYSCGLSVTCVFAGNQPLDLCNGGMVWSCCVPGELRDDSYSGGVIDIGEFST